MSKNNTVRISTTYMIATLFNKGISFLTVPLFTRLLSTSDYGIVTTYLSWVTLLSMIVGMALHTSIRTAVVDFAHRLEEITSTVISFTVIVFSAIVAIVIGGVTLLQVNASVSLVFMCLVQSMFSAVISDYSMYLMMKYRYKMRALLMIGPNLLAVILSIGAILYVFETDLYLGRTSSYCISYAIFGVMTLIMVFRTKKANLNRQLLRYALAVSTPLVLHGISLDILSQSDRLMLTWLKGPSQTGIYSLVYNFSMISTVITTGLEGVWVPWFISMMKAGNRNSISHMARHYIHLMTYVLVGLMLIAPEILRLLAPSQYWEGVVIIPLIVIVNYLIFSYTLFVNIEHYFKKTRQIGINTAIAVFANICLNAVLIPSLGYLGAAIASVTAYFLSFCIHVWQARKLDKIAIPVKLFYEPMMHMIVAMLIFYVAESEVGIRWVVAWGYVLAMLIRERYNIGELIPVISNKCSFFRKNKEASK